MSVSILFIGKKGDFYCERALDFTTSLFKNTTVIMGVRGDEFPNEVMSWSGDYIVSYLSPWIVRGSLLKKAEVAAINFHPGPPEYPGIGCTNFAIYNQESEFGVTCHHMAESVDTGAIIAVKRFHLFDEDTVYGLTQRCYSNILTLYYDVLSGIKKGVQLPVSNETWRRKPYTRQELNELGRVDPEMDAEEINRRVRAMSFPGAPGAFVDMGGVRFSAEE